MASYRFDEPKEELHVLSYCDKTGRVFALRRRRRISGHCNPRVDEWRLTQKLSREKGGGRERGKGRSTEWPVEVTGYLK